jgi:large conductance mechanosensitive channel
MFKKARDVLKENLAEFKEFAFKGNLIQLAIGVVLGGAFGTLIKSFVDNVFMPLISVFNASESKDAGYTHWQVKGIKFGAFLGDLVSFLIIALAIFILMVKTIGWIVKLSERRRGKVPGEPTTKTCPYCINTIPYQATRCGFCTSDLTADPLAVKAQPGATPPTPA